MKFPVSDPGTPMALVISDQASLEKIHRAPAASSAYWHTLLHRPIVVHLFQAPDTMLASGRLSSSYPANETEIPLNSPRSQSDSGLSCQNSNCSSLWIGTISFR